MLVPRSATTRRSRSRRPPPSGHGRRSLRRRHDDRTGRQQGAVRQDPGPHQEGHRRGRDARHRRPRPSRGPQQAATTCSPTVFANVTQRHDDRARGDLRPGAVDPAATTTRTRRSRSPTTRPYGLSGYVPSGDLERARKVAARAPRRQGRTSTAPPDFDGAVRRLQAIGQRPRVGRVRLRGVPRGEGDHGLLAGVGFRRWQGTVTGAAAPVFARRDRPRHGAGCAASRTSAQPGLISRCRGRGRRWRRSQPSRG